MNAELVALRRGSLMGPLARALMRVRLSTRVLMFTVSALAGAILYLVLNWPGRPAPVVVVSYVPQPAAVAAPAPLVMAPAVARAAGAGAAGSLIVDAARGVTAAANFSLTSRAASVVSVSPVAAASSAPTANANGQGGTLASAGDTDQPSAPVNARSSSHATSSASRLVPDEADGAAAPSGSAPSTNRIIVPTAAPASSGPNRIVVPTARPAR